jgi:hypothetical protein
VTTVGPVVSRRDAATRNGGHGGRRLLAAVLQGAVAEAGRRRGNNGPSHVRGLPRCGEEGTGRRLTVCSAHRLVEAEEATMALHPVAPVSGWLGEHVRGTERSGAEVVVVLV